MIFHYSREERPDEIGQPISKSPFLSLKYIFCLNLHYATEPFLASTASPAKRGSQYFAFATFKKMDLEIQIRQVQLCAAKDWGGYSTGCPTTRWTVFIRGGKEGNP